LKSGLIQNRDLAIFVALALVSDAIYYGYFAKDLLFEFLLNLAMVSAVSLYLFYSHSFAGGDCKMTVALAMLFPARYYLVYGNTNITLIAALGFAILTGYIYLLVHALWMIATRKIRLTADYIKGFLVGFIKVYLTAMVYITLLDDIAITLEMLGLFVNVWIERLICMLIAWGVGRFQILKNKTVLIPAAVLVGLFSILFRSLPLSMNPESYMLVLFLVFCQITIGATIYEPVEVEQLRKGMILSFASSLLMQSSITKGLPGVSTEDLKSRLSVEEVDSIKIWARATHTQTLTVVKKIPFAIFISAGFFCYYIAGSMLR
jgi:preflagellin peptidase FlaK